LRQLPLAGKFHMASDRPLITVLIATKDRPDDLRRTLCDLRRQDYPSVEMIVIDDGSADRLESIVREEWPTAVYVRESDSQGCPQRRSEGFLLAKGEYIVELDDDSSPVAPDALSRAVRYMQDHPGIGILSFHIFNGPVLPENQPSLDAKYAYNFVGCGAVFRTAAVLQTGGYRAFFQGEWEESEFSLRMLKAGWSVYFFPEVLIHHHVSPLQRRSARAWMRAFRNKLWAMIMHYPASRVLTEGSWVVALACWDAVRLFRPRELFAGFSQFAAGVPRAWRLRRPMSPACMNLYDTLRFKSIRTEEEFRSPPPCRLADLVAYYRRAWLNRPRQRSVWDNRPGDVGSSDTVQFAHEFAGGRGPASLGDPRKDQTERNPE
jgi:GT2 family glycosyltransferase